MEERKARKATAGEKLSECLSKNRLPMLAAAVAVVAAIAAAAVFAGVSSASREKGFARLDEISYALTSGSQSLDDDALAARRQAAEESLAPYLKKRGPVGARACMMAAELSFERKDYAKASELWKAAAAASKKAYTAPLALFNEASMLMETGDFAGAAALYAQAAAAKNFPLASHALFSEGCAWESASEWDKAMAAYGEAQDKFPDEPWAHLAKSRALALSIEGKAQAE